MFSSPVVGEWAGSPSLQWEPALQLDSHEVISGELDPGWKWRKTYESVQGCICACVYACARTLAYAFC